jgi:transcriptional regulator with XRE-family HTH domain
MREESTARRRELGSELRVLRKRRTMSGHELGRRLQWAPSNISRLETGVRPLPVTDVATFLGSCGATLHEQKRLLKLAATTDDLYWVRPYFDQLADPLKSVIIQENLAESLTTYEPGMIPGLLQTETYLRAAFQWAGQYTQERIDLLVKARLDRQNVLNRRNPPRCTFFIHERALRSMIGGARVMHEQLVHVVLSSNLRYCRVRVVPESAHAMRMLDNSFNILEFTDHPATVYVDTYAAGFFIDDRAGVEAHFILGAQLEQNALNEADSRRWLAQLASEYDCMEE